MNGIGVSPGIAIGKARVIKKVQIALTGILLKDEVGIAAEVERFDEAVRKAINEIEFIKQNTSLNLLDEDIQILETQIEFLSDPQIREDVVARGQELRGERVRLTLVLCVAWGGVAVQD